MNRYLFSQTLLVLCLCFCGRVWSSDAEASEKERVFRKELESIREDVSSKYQEKRGEPEDERQITIDPIPMDEDELIAFVRNYPLDQDSVSKKQLAKAINQLGKIKSRKAIPVLLEKLTFGYSEQNTSDADSTLVLGFTTNWDRPVPSLKDSTPAIAALQEIGTPAISRTLEVFLKNDKDRVLAEAALIGMPNLDDVLMAVKKKLQTTDAEAGQESLGQLVRKIEKEHSDRDNQAKMKAEQTASQKERDGIDLRQGKALIPTE